MKMKTEKDGTRWFRALPKGDWYFKRWGNMVIATCSDHPPLCIKRDGTVIQIQLPKDALGTE